MRLPEKEQRIHSRKALQIPFFQTERVLVLPLDGAWCTFPCGEKSTFCGDGSTFGGMDIAWGQTTSDAFCQILNKVFLLRILSLPKLI